MTTLDQLHMAYSEEVRALLMRKYQHGTCHRDIYRAMHRKVQGRAFRVAYQLVKLDYKNKRNPVLKKTSNFRGARCEKPIRGWR